MCVVIGLQSTGEANTNQVRELTGDVMEDFVSAPQQILLGFLENHFPTSAADVTDSEINLLHAQVIGQVYTPLCSHVRMQTEFVLSGIEINL